MRDQIIIISFLAIVVLMVLWQTSDARDWRKENKALRREVARLSKHPSTYHQPPPPYMRRYAEDE